MKRIISFFLMLLLLPCNAFAQDVIFKELADENIVPLNGVLLEKGEEIPVSGKRSSSVYSRVTFEDYICKYILEAETLPSVITGLGQFNIKKADFADAYFDVALKHPELLLVTGYSSVTYDENTLVVQSVVPKFNVKSREEADAAREIIAAGIKEYTSLAENYDTALEKLIVIHDKMVADCDYDVNVLDSETSADVPDSVHHAIGVFRDEKAVCQGYSQALYIIAKALEIEMDFCFSEEMNHMWNYVKLNEKWYHLDMTNDDPAEIDDNGNIIARSDTRASHRYFMVSDAGLKSTVHGSDARTFSGNVYSCNDDIYETDHIFNIDAVFTAFRGEDGLFHVPVPLYFEKEGISETVDFNSPVLYTGAAVSEFCTVESATGRNLYYVTYATKQLKNSIIHIRYDNRNQIQRTNPFDVDSDMINYVSAASNIPENMAIGFSAFLWNVETLEPYSVKAVWSQQ